MRGSGKICGKFISATVVMKNLHAIRAFVHRLTTRLSSRLSVCGQFTSPTVHFASTSASSVALVFTHMLFLFCGCTRTKVFQADAHARESEKNIIVNWRVSWGIPMSSMYMYQPAFLQPLSRSYVALFHALAIACRHRRLSACNNDVTDTGPVPIASLDSASGRTP